MEDTIRGNHALHLRKRRRESVGGEWFEWNNSDEITKHGRENLFFFKHLNRIATYDNGAVFVWDVQTACRIGWQEFLGIDFIFQILFRRFFICRLNISCDRLKNKYHSAGLLTLKILPEEVKHLFRDMWRLYRPRVIENMLESKVFPTFSCIRPHLRTIVSIEILLCH